MIYSIKQISILFANRNLTKDFSIMEIPQIPNINNHSNNLEALPNGARRLVQTITPSMDFSISFASEILSEEIKNIYLGFIKEHKEETMVVSHNDDGRIIGTFWATVKDFTPIGTITNGQGSNGTITFSLIPV